MMITKQHTPSYRPPFCPNPNCRYHNEIKNGWHYKKSGFFSRQVRPYRIQRFTCLHCRRSFSSQTFSSTYWQKRPDIDFRLFTKATGCMANRQIARDLNVAPETINRHLARLGRHCFLFHTRMMRHAKPPKRVAIDGFVTFELSQYFPFHHHVAVEKDTDFFLYFTDSEVRRSGTMTTKQKRRRIELEQDLGRPNPSAVRKDVAELLKVSVGSQPEITIYSDNHKAYPRAIQDIKLDCQHHITSSRDHRGVNNQLWEINLLDLVIRHGSANHKRETIAWSKRRQASAERLGVLLVWRNYMKSRREKSPRGPTPAMARGMSDKKMSPKQILGERLFPTQYDLPPKWELYYGREVETRGLGNQRRHQLKYAA
jgi:transposase-like protein